MELMTIQEAADALRVKPVTVRRYIAKGRLKAVRVGRGLRVDREAVEQLPEPAEGLYPDWLPPSGYKYAKYLKGIPTSDDDPLWNIVGIGAGKDDGRTDVSTNKHKYLAEAYLDTHES